MAAKDKRKKQLETKISTRELIITEAERLIAIKGVDGLRLAEIADLVGIQRPSIYSHFPSRSALLARIIARAVMDLKDDFVVDEGLDPLENLRNGARMLTRRMASHPAHVRIVLLDFGYPNGLPEFTEQFGPPGELEKSGVLRPMIDRIGNILESGEKAGTFRHYNPLEFYHTLLSVILVRLSLDYRKTSKKQLSRQQLREFEASIDDLCMLLVKR